MSIISLHSLVWILTIISVNQTVKLDHDVLNIIHSFIIGEKNNKTKQNHTTHNITPLSGVRSIGKETS